jgi:arginase family enzyme
MGILHAGIATFLKMPSVPPDPDALRSAGADVAVLGLPYDGTTVTRPGASHGPRAIRDASSHFAFGETYHSDYDVRTADHLRIVDCGDIDGVPGNAARTFAMTEGALDAIHSAGCFPVLIGGDHGTTIPGARSLARALDGPMGFIMFDTHLESRHCTGHRR